MTSLAPSASGEGITFVPGRSSYFYETLPCARAAARGYDAVAFAVRAPAAGASLLLEIQTRASCDAAAYASAWARVPALAGPAAYENVTVPLSAFVVADGAADADADAVNLDAVTALNWATWSVWDAEWELGRIELVCSNDGGGCAGAAR